jgi:hypothetical protein
MVAEQLGVVEVDMGDPACKISRALEELTKIEKLGRIEKKRKMAFC